MLQQKFSDRKKKQQYNNLTKGKKKVAKSQKPSATGKNQMQKGICCRTVERSYYTINR